MFNVKLVTVVVTAVGLLALAPLASAKDGDVRVRGACSAASTAKLKLSRQNGGIEVEFEVDQNRNGVPWKVTLRQNGTPVLSTTAITRAPSGSFSVRHVISSGQGTIVAEAVRSGERCTARATI